MTESIRQIGGGFVPAALGRNTGPARSFSEELRSVLAPSPGQAGGGEKSVGLGRISAENPTVSHLLVGHPVYRDACWEIVHSETNADKPFRNLPVGRAVTLDPETGEIFCGSDEKAVPAENTGRQRLPYVRSVPDSPAMKGAPESGPDRSDGHVRNAIPADSSDLAGALRSYIGTPYSKINCFELVVEGLKDLGVAYGGRKGLQNTLIRKALAQGLPMNAYLTGEGLIDASSTKVFESAYANTTDSKTRARQVMEEMKPILESGLILSFSTETRGHTGIVAKYGGEWTFLNSGALDHTVRPSVGKKGVGEEQLEAEIANWLRRAGRAGESLRITAGKLDSRKLVTFQKPAAHSPKTNV